MVLNPYRSYIQYALNLTMVSDLTSVFKSLFVSLLQLLGFGTYLVNVSDESKHFTAL